jgi:hypothetical protein
MSNVSPGRPRRPGVCEVASHHPRVATAGQPPDRASLTTRGLPSRPVPTPEEDVMHAREVNAAGARLRTPATRRLAREGQAVGRGRHGPGRKRPPRSAVHLAVADGSARSALRASIPAAAGSQHGVAVLLTCACVATIASAAITDPIVGVAVALGGVLAVLTFTALVQRRLNALWRRFPAMTREGAPSVPRTSNVAAGSPISGH